MTKVTNPTPEAVAVEQLTEAEVKRLLDWPERGSTFHHKPDGIALDLCEAGIGVIRPWKHGCQMALTARGPKCGIKVHTYLLARAALSSKDATDV